MIKIPKDEVLRYLGYKNQEIDKSLNQKIDDIIVETEKNLSVKYMYKLFDIVHLKDGVLIDGTNTVMYGEDIKNHLSKCKRCILIAVTIGADIEKKIMAKQICSINDAFIMDACATAAVECSCDELELAIVNSINNCNINNRYSPGYGDFSIDFQPKLLSLLDAGKKIGLYVNQSNILTPRKSVTAVIGVLDECADNRLRKKNKCDLCENKEGCEFRKK